MSLTSNINEEIITTDGDFFQTLRSIEREIIEDIGDKEAIAILDEEDRKIAEEEKTINEEYQRSLISENGA